MSIKVPRTTTESYVEALYEAADEIKLRAKEIIGDIDGQLGVSISININPHEVVTIDVFKNFISGWKQQKLNKEESS